MWPPDYPTLGPIAWASLETTYPALSNDGAVAYVTDVAKHWTASTRTLSNRGLFFMADGVSWKPFNGHAVLIWRNTPYTVTAPATTFATLTLDSNGGLCRFTSAGAHGLTSAAAVGRYVYVTWSGGTGTNGLYAITNVAAPDTTGVAITVNLTYDAGLGTPTVIRINENIELARYTIPGGIMGTDGSIRVRTRWEHANNSTTKTMNWTVDGVTAIWSRVRTATGTPMGEGTDITWSNVDSASAQRHKGNNSGNSDAYTSSLSATQTTAINTAIDKDWTAYCSMDVANDYITLHSFGLELMRM